jgi:hypothetical protein
LPWRCSWPCTSFACSIFSALAWGA